MCVRAQRGRSKQINCHDDTIPISKHKTRCLQFAVRDILDNCNDRKKKPESNRSILKIDGNRVRATFEEAHENRKSISIILISKCEHDQTSVCARLCSSIPSNQAKININTRIMQSDQCTVANSQRRHQSDRSTSTLD